MDPLGLLRVQLLLGDGEDVAGLLPQRQDPATLLLPADHHALQDAVQLDRVLHADEALDAVPWIFITGGCSRRGAQWMGVVLYNKTAYNTM